MGHKLSDSVVERLPTLCTLTQGGRISYSEVVAFHNIVRGLYHRYIIVKSTNVDECNLRNGHGRTVRDQIRVKERQVYMMNFYGSILREATAKTKDGRIDQSDFLNHAAASSRYSLFTPMEASIIFHFAGRGDGDKRLALVDFAQLLDPRWRAPHEESEAKPTTAQGSFLNGLLQSTYNFVQGGQPSIGEHL
jgi:solute carrier family 25 (mitochondrial aspartate/glutamate transporter), member 12/13